MPHPDTNHTPEPRTGPSAPSGASSANPARVRLADRVPYGSRPPRPWRVYIDRRDWWVGYYRGDTHHYVCPLPTVVIRWAR